MGRRIIGDISLPVNTALDPYLRVNLSGGYLVASGAGVQEIGVLEERVIGPPQQVKAAVIPFSDPSVRDGVASGPISAYVYVYADSGGQLTATPGASGTLRGMALTAAAGAGSQFQYLPFLGGGGTAS
jgi:hypothetical protein